MTPTRPTWAEVSCGRLAENYRLLRRIAPPDAELIAVIKADAYGHGLAACAPVLTSAHTGGGARWLGVTSLDEGLALRALCPHARILIMSGLWPGEADAALEHRLTPSVWEPAHFEWIEAAARARRLPPAAFPVHLEIDTGMSRQGVAPEGLAPLLPHLTPASPVRLEAVMTHFHSPGNEETTRGQEQGLAAAVAHLVAHGLRPDFLSAGSSATVLRHDTDAVTDLARSLGARRMLRPGLSLYGYAPSPQQPTELRPVLAWKTRVTGLRTIPAGATAGYDATFRASRPTRLALLPVGYADGFNRLLSGRGSVLVRGRHAPVAGRISMDQTTVDVTGIPGVAVGDEVVLIGEQGDLSITAHDLAALTGSICWEVLCAISARVPRLRVD